MSFPSLWKRVQVAIHTSNVANDVKPQVRWLYAPLPLLALLLRRLPRAFLRFSLLSRRLHAGG